MVVAWGKRPKLWPRHRGSRKIADDMRSFQVSLDNSASRMFRCVKVNLGTENRQQICCEDWKGSVRTARACSWTGTASFFALFFGRRFCAADYQERSAAPIVFLEAFSYHFGAFHGGHRSREYNSLRPPRQRRPCWKIKNKTVASPPCSDCLLMHDMKVPSQQIKKVWMNAKMKKYTFSYREIMPAVISLSIVATATWMLCKTFTYASQSSDLTKEQAARFGEDFARIKD